MPEASIHENDKPVPTKNEIGLSGQRNVPSPASDAVFSKNPNEFDLGVAITSGTNRRHHL
jgi:hypothetical protein